MVNFFGEYFSRVDDKGRMVLPSRLKNTLPAGSDLRFVVRKDLFQPCLQMIPYEEWEKRAGAVQESLDLTFNRNDAIFWREYMRNCDVVEPDAKLGRINLPRKFLSHIGIDELKKDVVFSGNGFMIEIWSRDAWEASEISNDEIIAIAESHSRK